MSGAVAMMAAHLVWDCLMDAEYLKEACTYDISQGERCESCGSSRICCNLFCMFCKEGGLCPMAFRNDQKHKHHPWLQVRNYSHKYAVLEEDLARFVSPENGVKYIWKNWLNGAKHCYLKSCGGVGANASSSHGAPRTEKDCRGCGVRIRSFNGSPEDFLVCSLECLVVVAEGHPELNLLRMEDGAMERMEPPLLYNEKFTKENLKKNTKGSRKKSRVSPATAHEEEGPSEEQAPAEARGAAEVHVSVTDIPDIPDDPAIPWVDLEGWIRI